MCVQLTCACPLITVKAKSWWSPSHTPNFNAIRPYVPEIRKGGTHVRTCTCSPPITSVKRLANGSLSTYKTLAQSIQLFRDKKKGWARACVQLCPTLQFYKSLANGSLTTYQISVQSVQPFPRYWKGDTSARVNVRMCTADVPHPWPVQYASLLGL